MGAFLCSYLFWEPNSEAGVAMKGYTFTTMKVTPVFHQELNRFLKIYSSLPWATDEKRGGRQNPA
jgi:hypothetical protein